MKLHIIPVLSVISLSRIRVLHGLVITRHSSVKILQIESKKITKADKIKKLNFENKYLYGSKINVLKKEAAVDPVEEAVEPIDSEKPEKHDISSEIYWTCLHVPEVQDFTKPKKIKRKKEKVSDAAKEKTAPKSSKIEKPLKVPKESKKKTTVKVEEKVFDENILKPSKKEPKKLKIFPQVLLPENLANLHQRLPSLKVDITEKLSANFQLRSIEKQPNADEQEIPFESPQLREIPNFPLTISKINRVVSEFEKFVPKECSILKPSVTKVLQATMPENQRHALMHWKQLKIAELGLERFEIMQKCEKKFKMYGCEVIFCRFSSAFESWQAIP